VLAIVYTFAARQHGYHNRKQISTIRKILKYKRLEPLINHDTIWLNLKETCSSMILRNTNRKISEVIKDKETILFQHFHHRTNLNSIDSLIKITVASVKASPIISKLVYVTFE
jgi:hypothetical protein